jgi:hypothetical protein
MRALVKAAVIIAGQISLLSAFAQHQVTLAWDPSTDPTVVGYNVYYGAASQTYTNIIAVGPSTSCVVSNLSAGTTYYFAATSVSMAGLESSYSTEVVCQPGAAPCSVVIANLSQVYDGTARPVSATTAPTGLALAVTYNGSSSAPVAAGTYQVVATVTDPNYTGCTTNTLVISKATASVQIASLSQVYDGTAKTVSTTTAPARLQLGISYNNSSSPPINAGAYQIVATVIDPNYTGGTTGTLTLSKAMATLQLSGLAQVYDGNSKLVSVTTAPKVATWMVSYNGGATVPTNAGSYAVAVVVSDPNYAGSASNMLLVSKAPAAVVLGNLNQTYDGTPKTVTATTTPQGLTTSVTYNGLTKAPSRPGSYNIIAIVNALNYAGAATNTLVISRNKAHAFTIAPALPNSLQVHALTVVSGIVTPKITIRWPATNAELTILESSDLLRWTVLTNTSGSSGSLSMQASPGNRFFIGETVKSGTNNSVRLSIQQE